MAATLIRPPTDLARLYRATPAELPGLALARPRRLAPEAPFLPPAAPGRAPARRALGYGIGTTSAK